MILFDTCVFLKYIFGSSNWNEKTVHQIKQLIQDKKISASVATLWEIECFSSQKLNLLGVKREELNEDIEHKFYTHFYSIDGAIIKQGYFLEDFHNDPADRFIVATAIVHKKELWTSDKKILQWSKKHSSVLKTKEI